LATDPLHSTDARPGFARTLRAMPPPVDRPRAGVLEAIGGTPLVRLERAFSGFPIDVWAKLEETNPGGSVKARAATSMLRAALDDGRVRPGGTVVESSSGNMGVGLAQACRYLDLRFVCVVDSRTCESKRRLMQAYGAEVLLITEPDPETGDLLTARLNAVAAIVRETPGAFWPDQYANAANAAAHATGTMREIDAALDGEVDYVFVATSTGGTLRGCHDYLRENGRTTTLVAVDAEGSVLFGGTRGRRLLPGFGAGIETRLSQPAVFDRLERVSDLDCVVGCRRLVEREAVLAGASSGGLVTALERLAPTMAAGSRCALVCADGGTAYLDTVYDDEWVAEQLACDTAELARRVARA